MWQRHFGKDLKLNDAARIERDVDHRGSAAEKPEDYSGNE